MKKNTVNERTTKIATGNNYSAALVASGSTTGALA
jgi:hypothetical protein